MARLVISRQTSLSTERYTKDGILKNVHVVLKDKPFIVDVGLFSSGNKDSLDLKSLVLEANLFYDSPEKEVNFINAKPFEYTAKINPEGTTFAMECLLKILSSQNENALFKLRIRAVNASTKKPIAHMEIDTEPIQVISKPSVLRKKQERERQKMVIDHPKQVKTECIARVPDNISPAPSASVKRCREDLIIDTLTLLQQQQNSQQKLLEQILSEQNRSTSGYESKNELCFHGSPVSGDSLEFENAFRAFVHAFNQLPVDERPCKVRKVLKEHQDNNVATIVDMMWSENWSMKDVETYQVDLKKQEDEFCQDLFATDIRTYGGSVRKPDIIAG